MSKYKPKDGCRTVWLRVTHDEYEFPVFIADTAGEMAKRYGTSTNTIYSSLSHMKNGIWSPYRKVRISID